MLVFSRYRHSALNHYATRTLRGYANSSGVYPALIGCLTRTSSSSPVTRDKCPSSRISADRQSEFCFVSRRVWLCFLPKWNAALASKGDFLAFLFRRVFFLYGFALSLDLRIFGVMKNMTGVFDSLSTDMHSNQITSNYHNLHKSQESPTLPVSTATDSSYYNNNQQAGQCTGSPYGQISSYQYQNSSMNQYGFGNAFGSYSAYGSCSSPNAADAGKYNYACYLKSNFIMHKKNTSCDFMEQRSFAIGPVFE